MCFDISKYDTIYAIYLFHHDVICFLNFRCLKNFEFEPSCSDCFLSFRCLKILSLNLRVEIASYRGLCHQTSIDALCNFFDRVFELLFSPFFSPDCFYPLIFT